MQITRSQMVPIPCCRECGKTSDLVYYITTEVAALVWGLMLSC